MIGFAMVCITVISCTKAKTDYEAELHPVAPDEAVFKEVISIKDAGYEISIETLNGIFYKGYNEIRLTVTNAETKKRLSSGEVSFLPLLTDINGDNFSCPHRYELKYNSAEENYTGYSVFTEITDEKNNWNLYLKITDSGKIVKINKQIKVQQHSNKNLNMTSFKGKDNEQYWIALISPRSPKVGENNLVAGIYKYNTPKSGVGSEFPDERQFSYSEVNEYTLQLDPRMPEPSMGNHSSPNNKDLKQGDDGLYHGVVNYTMTGDWTLNLIMQNQQGQILKGTVVPTTFTPGVEGVKSELHIDILF